MQIVDNFWTFFKSIFFSDRVNDKRDAKMKLKFGDENVTKVNLLTTWTVREQVGQGRRDEGGGGGRGMEGGMFTCCPYQRKVNRICRDGNEGREGGRGGVVGWGEWGQGGVEDA